MHDCLVDLDPEKTPMQQLLAAAEARERPVAIQSIKGRAQALLGRFASMLAGVVPSQRRAEGAAQESFRLLFTTPAMVEFIAIYRPAFGVRLLSSTTRGVHDFSETFLTMLISTPQSVLYQEIKDNENLARCGYVYPEHNELLHFLFADANTAKRLAVWRPVGEYVIAALRPDHDPEYVDFLNGRADFFDESEKWKDKTFVGLRFFDLMVTAAACQGIEWHMWLYYYPHFLEKILLIYDASGHDIDKTAEWPTRASYLIYVLFDTLVSWIKLIRDLPEGSPHLSVLHLHPRHENDNIPKSAALALGLCLDKLLRSRSIDEHFCRYIHDIVMHTVRWLEPKGNQGRFRTVMINAIVGRGGLGTDQAYGRKLKDLLEEIDPLMRADLGDYQAALTKAYG